MKDIDADRSSDRARIAQSFRKALHLYHRNAHVQARIATRLVERFAEAGGPDRVQRVLEFGCGTGLLTRHLAGRIACNELILNDLVADCETRIAPLLAGAPCDWRFLPGPIEHCALPTDLDLIASASAVQWVEDIPTLLRQLSRHLRPGGWLMISGFARGHFHELTALGSHAAAASYVDAENWPSLLPPDLQLESLHQETDVMRFAGLRDLLRHLRSTGVNGRAGHVWSRAKLAGFEADYRRRFSENGQLRLTYAPVYVIARKAR